MAKIKQVFSNMAKKIGSFFEKMAEETRKFFKDIGSDKKKLFVFIGCILIALVIIVSLIIFFTLKGRGGLFLTGSAEGEEFKEEYERLNGVVTDDGKTYPEVSLPANNKMSYTTVNEVLSVFEERKSAVIYFGYAKCLYCRSAVEVLLNVASTTALDKIYYLDIDKEEGDYGRLAGFLGEELAPEGKINAPLVVFVVNGMVVSYHEGTVFSQEDPYTDLDQSQIDGIGEIYKYGINDVLGIPN